MKQEQAAKLETYHNPDGSVGCVKITKDDGEVIIYGDEDVMHREIAWSESKSNIYEDSYVSITRQSVFKEGWDAAKKQYKKKQPPAHICVKNDDMHTALLLLKKLPTLHTSYGTMPTVVSEIIDLLSKYNAGSVGTDANEKTL